MSLRLAYEYKDFRSKLGGAGLHEELSAPLLVDVSDGFEGSNRRIMFIGQETYGWQWTKKLRVKYTLYKNDYPFRDVCSIKDFIHNDDAVEALQWGYREFDFAKYQPVNRRSPFWSAFHEVAGWPDVNMVWNNLSKCDLRAGPLVKHEIGDASVFLELQKRLFAAELSILRPHVCLFMTGPNRDSDMGALLPGVRLSQMADKPIRQIARVVHRALPAASFRTYHPRYLRQGGLWNLLETLRSAALEELGGSVST